MADHMTTPGYAGDTVQAVRELQGLRVDMAMGGPPGTVMTLPGLKEKSKVLAALSFDGSGAFSADIGQSLTFHPGKASGTLTLNSVVEDETATVHDIIFTFKDNPGPEYTEVQVGATDAESAANLADAINAYFAPLAESGYLRVTAEADAAVVTVTAWDSGTASNAIALAGSAQVTASAATLEGGGDPGLSYDAEATVMVLFFWYPL